MAARQPIQSLAARAFLALEDPEQPAVGTDEGDVDVEDVPLWLGHDPEITSHPGARERTEASVSLVS